METLEYCEKWTQWRWEDDTCHTTIKTENFKSKRLIFLWKCYLATDGSEEASQCQKSAVVIFHIL